MAWTSYTNELRPLLSGGIYGPHVCAYAIKERLKIAGCTVVASGDGVGAYGLGSDVITNYNPVPAPNSFANPLAWIALAHPGGKQFLLQNRNDIISQAYFLSAYSKAAGFVGGAFNTRATAADEVCHGHAGHAPTAEQHFAWADVYANMVVGDEIGGVIPWHHWQVVAGTALNAQHIGHGVLKATATGELDVSFQHHGPGAWSAFGGTPEGAAWYDVGGGGEAYYTAYAGALYMGANYYLPQKVEPNPTDGLRRTRRVDWWHVLGAPTKARWRGYCDLLWSPRDTSVLAEYNRLLRDQNGEIYVQLAHGAAGTGICIPGWPSVATCPLPDLGGGVVVEDVLLIDQISGDVSPPALTVVSPPVGGPIRPDEAFVIDVTDDIGLGLVVLTVETGSAHEVVWLRDAFSTAYSALSTRTAIAGGYRFSVRRIGGWTAAPIFHVEAIDNAGNLGA